MQHRISHAPVAVDKHPMDIDEVPRGLSLTPPALARSTEEGGQAVQTHTGNGAFRKCNAKVRPFILFREGISPDNPWGTSTSPVEGPWGSPTTPQLTHAAWSRSVPPCQQRPA